MVHLNAFLTRNSTVCFAFLAALFYGLPLYFGLWAAQLLANFYGFFSAFLLVIPFFYNDQIKKRKQQAQDAVVVESARVLKEGQIKRLDRLSANWTPTHLHMMQLGLVLLAVSYLLVITTMIVGAWTSSAAT